MSDQASGELVGTVAEQAMKLLDALPSRAEDSDMEFTVATSLSEHIANSAHECKDCPFWRAISLARATSPEVKADLTAAATSLVQAAFAATATQPSAHPSSGGGELTVEKVAFRDGGEDEPWL